MVSLIVSAMVLAIPTWREAQLKPGSHSQVANPRITIERATLELTKVLSKIQFGEKVNEKDKRSIEAIVNRIDWPNIAHIESFYKFLDKESKERSIPNKDGRTPAYQGFPSAVGLLCAAWDVRLERPQFVFDLACLNCCDATVEVISGKAGGRRANTLISPNWPWKSAQDGKLSLGCVQLAGWVGNKIGTMSDYVVAWNSVSRSKS